MTGKLKTYAKQYQKRINLQQSYSSQEAVDANDISSLVSSNFIDKDNR